MLTTAQWRRDLQAATFTFTPALVKVWRKEFLKLMSNIRRVKDFDGAEKWTRGAAKWGAYLESQFKQLRTDLDRRVRQSQRREIGQKVVNEGWANYYKTHQDPVWDFLYEIRSPPTTESWSMDRELENARTNPYFIERHGDVESAVKAVEDRHYDRWAEEARKWNQRARRKARKVWEILTDWAEWTLDPGWYGGGGEPAEVVRAEKVNQNIAGLSFQLIGFEGTDFEVEGLEGIKRGTAFYVQRAKQVFPWLIRYQLPIEAYFSTAADDRGSSKEFAASYRVNRITLSVWGIHADKKRFANIMAHEMGHHIFQTVLSKEAREDWATLIRGDYKELDLRDVLKMLRPSESLYKFDRRIENEDPILYLQLQTLLHDPTYSRLDLLGSTSIKDYLDGGGNPIVKVPAKPVTGYGGKNPEEAFCEVLGLLVGYGPRTVLPEMKAWFRRFVPGVKIAGVFEAPPKMMAAVEKWVFSRYCGNVLAQVEESLASATNAIKTIKAAAKELEDAVRTLKGDVMTMRPGDTLRFKLYEVRGNRTLHTTLLGVRLPSNYEGDPPDEWFYQVGAGERRLTFSNRGSWFEVDEVETSVRWKLERHLSHLKNAIVHFEKGNRQWVRDSSLVELHLMRAECLKYTNKAKRYVSSTSTKIPVDVTGWKYIRGDAPFIAKAQEQVDKANEATKRALEVAAEEYKLAKAYAKAELARAQNPTDDTMDAEHNAYQALLELQEKHPIYWTPSKIRHHGKLGDSFALVGGEWVPANKVKLLAPVELGNVNSALRSTGWDAITCTLHFKSHKRRGGQWNWLKKVLEVDVFSPSPQSVKGIREGMEILYRTIRHEMQHVGQDLLQKIQQLPQEAGLPSKAIRDPGYDPLGRARKIPSRKRREHALQDVEFYTRLADEIGRFVGFTRKWKRDTWADRARQWVGAVKSNITASFFKALKRQEPRKWQKAVKEFIKGVEKKVGDLGRGGFKLAKSFNLNIGDPVLFGKYKNKKGVIKGFKTGPKGDPIVVIEPVPKGRKQDKEVKLFRIRYDKSRDEKEASVLANSEWSKLARVGITRLVMFDFDGTLFRGAEFTPEWWTDPTPFSWGSHPISMKPPCVPGKPGPEYWNGAALRGLRDANADPNTWTLLITGRIKTHRPRVRELLKQQGVTPKVLYFNPGMSAVKYKKDLLAKIISGLPDIETVELWENENLAAYKSYVERVGAHLGKDIEVIAHQVRDRDLPYQCDAEDLPNPPYPVQE
jgi:hypothetical protein